MQAKNLTVNGSSVDPSKLLTSDNFNYGKLVGEIVVTSPTTSVSFAGLDGNTHGGYVLVADVINATASAATLRNYFEGDTTSTNYFTTVTACTNTGATSGGYANTEDIGTIPASGRTHLDGSINMTKDGYVFCNYQEYRSDSTITARGSRNAVVKSNITTIEIRSSVSNSIGINSRFRLYRRL